MQHTSGLSHINLTHLLRWVISRVHNIAICHVLLIQYPTKGLRCMWINHKPLQWPCNFISGRVWLLLHVYARLEWFMMLTNYSRINLFYCHCTAASSSHMYSFPDLTIASILKQPSIEILQFSDWINWKYLSCRPYIPFASSITFISVK